MFFFFNATASTESYTYGHTLSLHDALPISWPLAAGSAGGEPGGRQPRGLLPACPAQCDEGLGIGRRALAARPAESGPRGHGRPVAAGAGGEVRPWLSSETRRHDFRARLWRLRPGRQVDRRIEVPIS